MDDEKKESKEAAEDFAAEASMEEAGFFAEFWGFLRDNKKWWLGPIIVVMLIMGALFTLASTSAAPFIYTLF